MYFYVLYLQVCGPSAKLFLWIKMYVVAFTNEATSMVTAVGNRKLASVSSQFGPDIY